VPLIFFSSLAVGFSGAMMPGPLLTYTIRQSLQKGPSSGFVIITGHALLEAALIILIFLGFDVILQSTNAQITIGIAGGLLLIYMGADMVISALKKRVSIDISGENAKTGNMLLSGALISAANPYFILWWAVIGLGFLVQAYKLFGAPGVIIFFVGHILADYIWYGAISAITGKSRRFISDRIYRVIIISLGAVLVFFGGSFFYNAFLLLT
jgi:threonine/homoserine/homoserine lactone efflux protein